MHAMFCNLGLKFLMELYLDEVRIFSTTTTTTTMMMMMMTMKTRCK